MRPIKFRAWDDVEDKMYYTGEEMDVVFSFDDNGIVAEKILGDYETEKLPYLKYMQFTGLYDKNGTPIYEGDIVTGQSFESSMLNHWKSGILKHLDYEVEYVPEMYVIKYHEASFKTFDLKGKWVAVLNHHVSSMVDDLQVIGNIYENPELLEGDN